MTLHVDCREKLNTETILSLPEWLRTVGLQIAEAQGLVCIDKRTQLLLLEKVAYEAQGPFWGLRGTSVLAQSLAETFFVATISGLGPNHFEQLGQVLSPHPSHGVLLPKVFELGRLYRLYLHLLSGFGVDEATLFCKGIDGISTHSQISSWRNQPIVVHGLESLPKSGALSLYGCLRALRALACAMNAPSVQILLPEVESRPVLEQALTTVLHSLFSFYEENFEEVTVPWIHRDQGDKDWEEFLNRLFCRQLEPKVSSSNGRVFYRFSFSTPRSSIDEATQIASHIRTLLEQGFSPERIAIIGQSAKRRQRIAAALAYEQIPFRELGTSELGQENAPLASRLRILFEFYQLDELDVKLPKIQSLLQSAYLREAKTHIASFLSRLPVQGSFSVHAAALLDLGRRLHIIEHVDTQNSAKEMVSAEVSVLAERARYQDGQAIFELIELLNYLASNFIQNLQPRTSLGRREFISLLKRCLPVAASSESEGTITIGALDSLLAGSYEHVFLMGLVRGEFPDSNIEDPLLSDGERLVLNQRLGLPIFPLRLAERQMFPLHFVQLLAASEVIHLFCPQLDDQNRHATPSIYLEEIQNALGIKSAMSLRTQPIENTRTPKWQESVKRRIRIEQSRDLWFSSYGRDKNVASSIAIQEGGYVGDLSSSTLLDFSGLGSFKNPLSVSAFEDYACCPFRFFLKHVLHLEQNEESSDDLDPMALGQGYHQILFQFFQLLKDQGRLPLRGDRQDFSTLDMLIASAQSQTFSIHLLGHPSLLLLRLRQMKERLHRLLQNEAQDYRRGEATFSPDQFEVPFLFKIQGPPDQGPGSFIYIRGKIDRIDRNEEQILVLDYKLGGTEFYDTMIRTQVGITSLQLPLYALAVKKDLRLQEEFAGKKISARYYSIKQGRLSKNSVDEHSISESKLYAMGARLQGGDFRIAPKTCNGCGFENACRIKKTF